jgi:histidyl-tRNA synthetase
VDSPLVDVELIFILLTLFSRLSVSDVAAHINSLGCPECRPEFKAALSDFLTSSGGDLCSDCVRRKDRNPLRVLDCKVPACRTAMTDAPSILDHLCPACNAHFDMVKTALNALDVPFTVDKKLVRGLDYYTRTTFEIQTGELGAQNAVAGGGRYDGLIKALGGPDTPATGFAIGFDRLAEISDLNRRDLAQTPDIYIAALGEKNQSLAFEWKCAWGLEGIQGDMEFGDKSLKSQMKRAHRLGAKHALIVGDNEVKEGAVILRDMTTKEQKTIPIEDVVEKIIEKFS